MKLLSIFLITLLVVLGITAILALPVQWLWNYAAVAAMSGAREITWLEAWGLMFLVHLLFRFELVTKKTD